MSCIKTELSRESIDSGTCILCEGACVDATHELHPVFKLCSNEDHTLCEYCYKLYKMNLSSGIIICPECPTDFTKLYATPLRGKKGQD